MTRHDKNGKRGYAWPIKMVICAVVFFVKNKLIDTIDRSRFSRPVLIDLHQYTIQ